MVVDLPNLGTQLINIINELCGFHMRLLGLEVYCHRESTVWILYESVSVFYRERLLDTAQLCQASQDQQRSQVTRESE